MVRRSVFDRGVSMALRLKLIPIVLPAARVAV
jgi:hypothetical protein